jgi:hypothetical protein
MVNGPALSAPDPAINCAVSEDWSLTTMVSIRRINRESPTLLKHPPIDDKNTTKSHKSGKLK